MILGAQNVLYGSTPGAWRSADGNAARYLDGDAIVESAKLAEKGKFHFVFIADHAAVREDLTYSSPSATLDPIVIVSQLIRETSRIGFVLTQSTSTNFPYTVARQLKALDVLSKGRIGWNAVTTNDPRITANYGKGIDPRHIRYEKAHEFIQTVQSLWASWGETALKLDKVNGIFADASQIQPIEWHGKYFSSRGPLPIPPSPQGQPVIFQAGGGQEGLELAAMYSSGVYSIMTDEESGKAHRKALDDMMMKVGRDPDQIKLFMGITVTVAEDDQSALERRKEMLYMMSDELSSLLMHLSQLVNVRIDETLLHTSLPEELLKQIHTNPYQLHSSRACELLKKGLTPFEVLAHGVTDFHTTLVGSSKTIADEMEALFTCGACDGFIVVPDRDGGLEAFVEIVIPILQERGLFHREYEGETLRSHLQVDHQYGINQNIKF